MLTASRGDSRKIQHTANTYSMGHAIPLFHWFGCLLDDLCLVPAEVTCADCRMHHAKAIRREAFIPDRESSPCGSSTGPCTTHLLHDDLYLVPAECLLLQQLSSQGVQLRLVAGQDGTRTVVRTLQAGQGRSDTCTHVSRATPTKHSNNAILYSAGAPSAGALQCITYQGHSRSQRRQEKSNC